MAGSTGSSREDLGRDDEGGGVGAKIIEEEGQSIGLFS